MIAYRTRTEDFRAMVELVLLSDSPLECLGFFPFLPVFFGYWRLWLFIPFFQGGINCQPAVFCEAEVVAGGSTGVFNQEIRLIFVSNDCIPEETLATNKCIKSYRRAVVFGCFKSLWAFKFCFDIWQRQRSHSTFVRLSLILSLINKWFANTQSLTKSRTF